MYIRLVFKDEESLVKCNETEKCSEASLVHRKCAVCTLFYRMSYMGAVFRKKLLGGGGRGSGKVVENNINMSKRMKQTQHLPGPRKYE